MLHGKTGWWLTVPPCCGRSSATKDGMANVLEN